MDVIRDAMIMAESGDSKHFTGCVCLKRLVPENPDAGTRLYRVRFEAKARTNWHWHPGEQLLLVLEGTCRLQKRGEEMVELGVGDVARITRKEEHWHGAAPDAAMTHIAVTGPGKTQWLEEVVETEYQPS